MSYARWGWTDVYVYDCHGIGLICESCPLMHGPAGYYADREYTNGLGMTFRRGDRVPYSSAFVAGDDAAAMLLHLKAHVASGGDVGEAIEALQAEIDAGEWTDAAREIGAPK